MEPQLTTKNFQSSIQFGDWKFSIAQEAYVPIS